MAILYIPIKQEYTFSVVQKQRKLLSSMKPKARLLLSVVLLPFIFLYLVQEFLLMIIKVKLFLDMTIEKSSSQLFNRRMTPIVRGLSLLLIPATLAFRFIWFIFGVAFLNLASLLIHLIILLLALINSVFGAPLWLFKTI